MVRMPRYRMLLSGAAGAALVVAAFLLQRSLSRPFRPDVLVIVVDTLRADRLGSYGGPRPTSPNLDALARESVLFEETNVSSPRTWSSFSSILTGLYPPRHGVRFIYDDPLPASVPNLASILRAHGYQTTAFDPIAFVRDMTGGKAFDVHFDSDAVGHWVQDHDITETVGRWLVRPFERPRLAFVRLQGPHWPYRNRPEDLPALGAPDCRHLDHSFLSMGHGDGLDFKGPGKGFAVSDPAAYRRLMFDVDRRPEVLEHRMVHYDAAIRTTDAYIGRLLETLRTSGRLDKTLVVVTSDHGESVGEHGYLQHGPRVDFSVMRVPLLIRFPARLSHCQAGQRVSQLVRSVDVLPTILDTLGLPAPDALDGVSLLPAVRGEDLRLTCYAESEREFAGVDPELALPGNAGKQRMVRTLRWKLLYRHDGQRPLYRLFDLAADPSERHDVGAEHPKELAMLRDLLDRFMRLDAGDSDGQGELTPEQKEQLRALGYIN